MVRAVSAAVATRYPEEVLHHDDDDGTMPANRDALEDLVVGHKIVSFEKKGDGGGVITLDNGKRVSLDPTWDCCAYTDLQSFLLNPELVDHVIVGVGTTDQYTTWHVYADAGDVLKLTVGWSCGNPFYYGYGFNIYVEDDDAS